MQSRKPRKPPVPKPIYGVQVLEFRYSYSVIPPPKRIPSFMPQPKKPKVPKPIFVWVMKYKSPAPEKEKQREELRDAVAYQMMRNKPIVKSMKYVKSTNPALYLQVKTMEGAQLVEISRLK